MIEAVIDTVLTNVSGAQPAPKAAAGDIFSRILGVVLSGMAAGAAGAEDCVQANGGQAWSGEEAAPCAGPKAGRAKTDGREGCAVMALVAGLACLPPAAPLMIPAGDAVEGEVASAPAEEPGPAAAAGAQQAAIPENILAALLAAEAAMVIPAANQAPAARGAAATPATPAAPAVRGSNGVPATPAVPAAPAIPATPVMAAVSAANFNGPDSSGPAVKELKTGEAKPAGDAAAVKGAEKPAPQAAARFAAEVRPGNDNSPEPKAGDNKNRQLPENGAVKAAADAPAGEGARAPGREALPEKSMGRYFTAAGIEAAAAPAEIRTYARAAKAQEAPGFSAAGVEQIALAVDRLEGAGRGKLSLEINEPGLGKVRVDMAISGGDLNISLEVENKAAGKFLSAKVPELMEALAQRGLNSGVQLFAGSDGGQNSGREERAPSRRFNNALPEAAEQEIPVQEEGRLSLYA